MKQSPHADEIVEMFVKEELEPKGIAARLNDAGATNAYGGRWTEDSVRRILDRRGHHNRHGKHRRRPSYTAAQRERVLTLRREGMPLTIVARETGVNHSAVTTISERAGIDSSEATAEWFAAWQPIRKNPELLALHREFFPGSGKVSR